MAETTTAETHRVDAFEAAARMLTPADRDLMYELTVSVFWPHRAHDLELLLTLGRGYLACDQIGRPLGSGMYFEMGPDLAMIGMMVTASRLQTHGAGRWLLQRITGDCAGRDLRVYATKQAYHLYHTDGFIPVAPVQQQQGVARPIYLPETPAGLELRDLVEGDRAELPTLDHAAFGANRTQILEALLKKSEGMIATRGGVARGFALIRNFGRGRVIGPVVAEDDAMAMALIAPLIQRHKGKFLRLDTPRENSIFNAFLSAAGLGIYDTVTEMRKGALRGGEGAAKTYGLAAQALG